MKKVVIALIVLMMVMVTACGGHGAKQEAGEAAEAEELAETVESGEGAEAAEAEEHAETVEPTDPAESGEQKEKTLIVYFSRAGENYNVGTIEKGNTEKLAELISDETGYDLFKIETVKEYPESYDEMLTIATEEGKNKERPELKSSVEGFDEYSRILLGYPIWWSDMPMAVYTFLESYDFSGKTIYPFNTHEGSGSANTVQNIRNTVPSAEVKEGFAITGATAQNDEAGARTAVQGWLEENALYPD